jgi:hypothetical protein
MNAKLGGVFAVCAAVALAQSGHAQPRTQFVPKLEPVAETKLLMNGLAHPNFKGLERILSQEPAEDQSWTFARGQALLLAETANLLMIRPPRNPGETTWMERATALRGQAAQLAQTASKKDLEAARADLRRIAESCNSCHQSFKVPVQIEAFAE